MSKKSMEAKIDFILEMIENIQIVIHRHNGIVNALSDRAEARPAILMALMQIGESLIKIDEAILIEFDLLNETKGAYNVRNFIAHDYEGVDMGIVEDILRMRLDMLNQKILAMLSKNS